MTTTQITVGTPDVPMSASPVSKACLRLPAQILGLGLALCKAGQCSALMALTVPDLEPLLTSRWELSQQNPSLLGSGEPCAELPLSVAETGVPAFVLTLFLSPACPSAACLCRFPSLPEGWALEHTQRSPRCPPRTCHGPVWCHHHLLLSPGLLLAWTQGTQERTGITQMGKVLAPHLLHSSGGFMALARELMSVQSSPPQQVLFCFFLPMAAVVHTKCRFTEGYALGSWGKKGMF